MTGGGLHTGASDPPAAKIGSTHAKASVIKLFRKVFYSNTFIQKAL